MKTPSFPPPPPNHGSSPCPNHKLWDWRCGQPSPQMGLTAKKLQRNNSPENYWIVAPHPILTLPPPKRDQVFCLTKLDSVIGNLSPLLSTIRYDYQPESPTTQTKGTNILNLMRSKEIFFLKKKDASCFHLSFRRKWANVKVHSSMESFWAILGISNQPPSPHPHEISIPSLS